MAWDSAYATALEYRNRIDKSITADDTAILAGLTAISRHIENVLDRRFNQTSAGVARYFDAGQPMSDDDPRARYLVTPRVYDNSAIKIDDIVTMTELASDTDGNGTYETVAGASDTFLRPYNAAESGKPYTSIALAPLAAVSVGGYAKAVRITGTWGWPAVPADIKEATIQLTAILRLETQRAQATITELGGFVQASPQARGIVDALLHEYNRKPVLV